MKKTAHILGLSIVILCFVMAVCAQEKTKLEPLAADASLAETQSWLINALERSHKIKNDAGKTYTMKAIESSGCQMSFSQYILSPHRYMVTAPQNIDPPNNSNLFIPPSPGDSYFHEQFKNGSINPDPFLTRSSASPFPSASSKIKLDFNLKSADQLIVSVPVPKKFMFKGKTVYPPNPDTKVTQIVLAFMDTPPASMSNGIPVFIKSGIPHFNDNFIYLGNEDAPLVMAGFKHLAALCAK